MGVLLSKGIAALFRAISTKGVNLLWENKNDVKLYWKTMIGKFRNQDIRFSISYIYKIRIPDTDSYLLVRNRKIRDQLQPVGGVYKRYGDDKLFDKWGYKSDNQDNGVGSDKHTSNDLRFRVKGKNVIKVIKWFEELREREVSANREFIEELIDTGILDNERFRKINYKYVRRFSKHLAYSEYHKCYEVLIYDVLEFLPTLEQENALRELYDKGVASDDEYAFVSDDEIGKLRCVKNGKQTSRIGHHTKLIINETF